MFSIDLMWEGLGEWLKNSKPAVMVWAGSGGGVPIRGGEGSVEELNGNTVA